MTQVARVTRYGLALALSVLAPAALSVHAETPRALAGNNVQATTPSGVVVRVKDVVVTDDATLVTISASYSGESIFIKLADSDSGTYLVDENGQRFPLRKPKENKWLRVNAGDTMQGRLVFLGTLDAATKKFKLVFNEGSAADDRDAPGLSIDVPLS